MVRVAIEFGPFRLDTDPNRLWRGSGEVPLRAKSLGVLAYLARRPERLVTKDELREQIWDSTKSNPTSAMPPFGKNEILTEQEIDQLVEFIYTL